jgi:hypothetical protein
VERRYVQQETTRGERELEVEGEILYGKPASARVEKIRAA